MRAQVLLLVVAIQCHWSCLLQGTEPAATPLSVADQLYTLYKADDFFELAAQLPRLGADDPRRVFFEGQLDAAFRRDDQAEEKLQSFLAQPHQDGDWRKEAWSTLGGSRARRGAYGPSAEAIARAFNEPGAQFTPDERRELEQDLGFVRVLTGAPAQVCTQRGGPDTLPVHTDKANFLHVDIRVDAQKEDAVFETLAGVSCATESFARRHHFHLLPGRAEMQSATGNPVPVQVALADEVRIGKTTCAHVVFAVLRDEDMRFGPAAPSVIIGIPLILALERIRFVAADSVLQVGWPNASTPPDDRSPPNLAFDGLVPIANLQYRGMGVPLRIDTAAQNTDLSPRFAERFPEALADAKPGTYTLAGAGGKVDLAVRVIPTLELSTGGVTAVAHQVNALAKDPSFGLPVNGTLGEDFLKNGFELDFRRRRFSLLDFWDAVPTAPPTKR